MTLTRGEIVAAVDGLSELFYCEPLRAINKIRNGRSLGAALHPGSDNAWRCPNALLIYQPMDRRPLAWGHRSLALRRKSRALWGEMENVRSPASRSALYTEKKKAYILTVSPQLRSAPCESIVFPSLAGEGCLVLLTCVLFDLGGSQIDDGVDSGQPG